MVPKGWEQKKFKDITIKVGSGITPRGGSASYKKEGIPLIRSQNVLWGDLDLSDAVFINQEQHRKMKSSSLQKYDVLLNITGASIGRATVFKTSGDANINQHVCIIRTNESANHDFLKAFLLSYYGQKQIEQFQAGGNRQGLNFEQIRSFKILLPPLPEQIKIAKILSTWDKAIATVEQLITNSQQQKKALMQQLLTGKKHFEGFEDNWKKVIFDEVLNIEIGGTPSRSKPEYWDDKKLSNNRWLSIANLKGSRIYDTTEYITDLGVKNSNVTLIPAGTIVMSFKLTIGRRAILMNDSYTNEAICALIIKNKDIVNQEFLYQAIDIVNFDLEIDQAIKGKTLNKQKLKRLKLVLPCYQEQQKIASVLSSADQETELLNKKLALLKTEKKSLMQQLLTGKRRVKVDKK